MDFYSYVPNTMLLAYLVNSQSEHRILMSVKSFLQTLFNLTRRPTS